jgi:hypothetical protein
VVVTTTPAAKAMAGTQTTINNQLKVAAATVTERTTMTATTTTMKTKAKAATAAAWRLGACGGGKAA